MTSPQKDRGLRIGLARPGEIALMGHVVADFPDRDAARAMIANMVNAGVRQIEIQIPFSELVADGPVFMAANHDALKRGVTVSDAMALMKEVSSQWPAVDFIFMCYLNVVYKAGYASFARQAAAAGARAVIIPDLPIENSGPVEDALQVHEMINIRLVAPNTDNERMKTIVHDARGLVYAVARAGVTGGATSFSDHLRAYTDRIRAVTNCPIGLGFGVRTPEDIDRLRGLCDVAIIGTAALQAWAAGGISSHRNFWENMSSRAKRI